MFKLTGKGNDREIQSLKKRISELEAELSHAHEKIREENSAVSKEKLRLTTWFWNVILSMRSLVGTLDRDDLVNSVFKLLKTGLNAQSVQLFMIDDDELYPLRMEGAEAYTDLKELSLAVGGDHLIGWVAQNAQMVSSRNLDQSLKGLVDRGPIETVMCAPLMSTDKVYGVINISSLGGKEYDARDEQFFSLVSTMAGLSMQNSALFHATKLDLTSAKRTTYQQLEEKKKLRGLFEKYVSVEVVNEILNNSDLLTLGGHRQIITVLFADIRGFTSLSESLDPEEVVGLLNETLSELTEVLFRYGGTLDKYMGDCVMALFGVPVAMKDSAVRAVMAALAMVERIGQLRQKWAIEGKGLIDIGIAINTGEAVVGNVGSEKRMDYTAIGDTVNITSRLEDMAEAGHILISGSTYERVKDFVEAECLGTRQLRGKTRTVKVYKVKSPKKGVNPSKYLKIEVDQMEITQQYTARRLSDNSLLSSNSNGSEITSVKNDDLKGKGSSNNKNRQSLSHLVNDTGKMSQKEQVQSSNISNSSPGKVTEDQKLFKKGMALAKQRKYDEAAILIEKAVDLTPDNARYHYGLGLVYFKNKEFEKAKSCFSLTLEIEPSFMEARAMLNAVGTGE